MTDQDLNYAVAVRVFGEKRVTRSSDPERTRVHVDLEPIHFQESIECCRHHMITFLEKHGLQWSFCNHILAQYPAETNVWAAMKATPRQWCEAFLTATEHLAEKPKKAKKG